MEEPSQVPSSSRGHNAVQASKGLRALYVYGADIFPSGSLLQPLHRRRCPSVKDTIISLLGAIGDRDEDNIVLFYGKLLWLVSIATYTEDDAPPTSPRVVRTCVDILQIMNTGLENSGYCIVIQDTALFINNNSVEAALRV